MKKWENFEIECTEYLNKKFGSVAVFVHQGGSDSTVPDILVKPNITGRPFYIEAKHSPAQCGQFVLLPNVQNRSFEYSSKNVNHLNNYATEIIKYMNENFYDFLNAGTTGKDVVFANCSQIFSEWITHTYAEKGVKYFITNNYTIVPINRFSEYFEISAKYRIKRSGSRSVGKNDIDYFSKALTDSNAHKYAITNIRIIDEKLFVKSNRNLHNERFIYQQYEYMFSQRGSEYELRKLSNTYNANVIFSIKLIENRPGISNSDFMDLLT